MDTSKYISPVLHKQSIVLLFSCSYLLGFLDNFLLFYFSSLLLPSSLASWGKRIETLVLWELRTFTPVIFFSLILDLSLHFSPFHQPGGWNLSCQEGKVCWEQNGFVQTPATTFDMFLLICIKASIFVVLILLPGTILSTLPVLTYSVSPQPQEWGGSVVPFHSWGHWGRKRLHHLPKVTQLTLVRWSQDLIEATWPQSLCS